MADSDKIKYAPILPFDVTYGEHLSMYDNFVYHKDNNVCNLAHVCMESGNVYKFFRCTEQEPYLIGGN